MRAPAGNCMSGVFRDTPGGYEPMKMMSDGIEMIWSLPSPTIHSPNAMLLLIPSVISASLTGGLPPFGV